MGEQWSSASEPERYLSSSDRQSGLNTTHNNNYRELFQRIQRRNGEIVDFDRDKITEAIWKAARSVGGSDRRTADLLADKVILFLARSHEDHLLNIEEVQDAVEKVLIENGHARTAKAFILYREERARVRRFRNRRPPAGAEAFDASKQAQDDIEVLTSGEEVVHWDRERITQTLVRETGLAWRLADRISREVERQIIYSKTARLTASLIREMVNVKLLEYGFPEESQRHGRLGVPLYDVEQILYSRSRGKPSTHVPPELSGAVLSQYSLSRVYSREIAEAHRRGDLHIHSLDDPWRLSESAQSLDYLKRVGLCFPLFSNSLAPAQSARELVFQLGRFHQLLDTQVHHRSSWEGVNVFLAPLLEGMDDEGLREVARHLIQETGMMTSAVKPRKSRRSLGFYFHIPKLLWNTAALGPGGVPNGKTYAYYEETSRRFLEIFLETLAEGDAQKQPLLGLECCLHLDRRFFDSGQMQSDIQLLERCLPKVARWSAWYHGDDTGQGRPMHFCLSESPDQTRIEAKYPWKLRSSAGPVITINLPALALQAEGNPAALSSLIEEQINLCFTAFRQHREFMARTGGGESGGLSHCGDGEPFLRSGTQYARIALWGAGRLAQWHTGTHPDNDPESTHFLGILLEGLVRKVDLSARSEHQPCEVVLERDESVARRLAHSLALTGQWNLSDPLVESTPAVPSLEESPGWSEALPGAQEITVSAREVFQDGEENPVAELLNSMHQLGRSRRLNVAQTYWACRMCCRLLEGCPDICPRCGSLELEPVE